MTANSVRSAGSTAKSIIATNADLEFSMIQTTTLPNATFSRGRNSKRDGNG
jgi:hypothetical protein